ncbi:wolfamin [Mytilus galloprovincialis]|uniref:Wolfamin n=1 Tax=Mytilus galloprovincialis TaxID=29158 RepID=A0A8B6EXV9_MYTGA|nr:wolfamin [Mytilus galloprovincialis]
MAEVDKGVDQKEIAKLEKEAVNGDDESQIKLGKHFLTLADSEIKREINGEQAVKWFIQASRQGNDEATQLLQKCQKTKTGITEFNKEDVEWCVNTSNLEKKVRQAARKLYTKMNDTHKEVLSKEDYITAVKRVTGGDVLEQKLLLAAGKKIGDSINETEFVKILSKKIQGNLTLTSEETEEHSSEYKSAGIVTKVYRYPKETFQAIFEQGFETVSKEGMNWVTSLIPTNQIQLLILFYLYNFISTPMILLIVPLLVFYLSALVMIVATVQMFYKKKKMKDAAALANVLKTYDVGVDVNETRSQYSWNSLTPYLVFFGALPLTVISFSLANKMYIPCSEFCILAGAFAGLCFTALSDSHDMLMILAVVFNLIASLPTFVNSLPQIPFITAAIKLVLGAGFSVEIGAGFQINLGLPTVSYLVVPVMFILMAARGSWKGTYQVLVPHLVCYFWWQLMVAVFPFTTWKGLIRSSVGYFFLPMLIPLSVLLIIVGFFYVVYKLLMTAVFGKLVVTLLLGGLAFLLSQTKTLFGKKTDKKLGTTKKIVMGIFAVLALLPIIFVQLPTTKKPSKQVIAWEEYRGICALNDDNSVPEQLACSSFIGSSITWTGTFKEARISKIENSVEPLLKGMPGFIANYLRCSYGGEYGDCNDETKSDKEKQICSLMTSLGHECHLNRHNSYSFSLQVKMEEFEKGTLVLNAGNNFKETLSALAVGDRVEFSATLVDGAGSLAPQFKLKSIKCLDRELDVMVVMVENDEDLILQSANEAIAVGFNFFWYPLAEYIPDKGFLVEKEEEAATVE